MLIIKFWNHFFCCIKKLLYHMLWGNRVSFGRKTTFRQRFDLAIEEKGKVTIGNRCFFNNDCSIICMNKVSIGEGTLFGEGVRIYDHNHRFNKLEEPIKTQGYSIGEVTVGKHCWIGSNVVLLKGAKIGDNCVIGAGCVIAQEIPENTVVKMTPQMSYEKLQETFQ